MGYLAQFVSDPCLVSSRVGLACASLLGVLCHFLLWIGVFRWGSGFGVKKSWSVSTCGLFCVKKLWLIPARCISWVESGRIFWVGQVRLIGSDVHALVYRSSIVVVVNLFSLAFLEPPVLGVHADNWGPPEETSAHPTRRKSRNIFRAKFAHYGVARNWTPRPHPRTYPLLPLRL
jgi:hypothetical protein